MSLNVNALLEHSYKFGRRKYTGLIKSSTPERAKCYQS